MYILDDFYTVIDDLNKEDDFEESLDLIDGEFIK